VGAIYSSDEERELRERIKRLVQEEKAGRNERHRLESQLRALVMARYRELYRRFGLEEL
jgi:plasmid stabilization system protein ParE